jgi:serine/threonine-protein kinase
MKVILEVIKGPEVGRVFEFTQPDTFIVGRAKDAHFRLSNEDPYIGRRHFMLEISPPKVMFKEFALVTNPTLINDVPRVEAELFDGDVIEVGYTQLRVSISQKISTRTVQCRRCGEPIAIMADEAAPQYCSRCAREIEIEKHRKKARQQKPQAIACQCGKDLTERANSDGRAEQLLGVVRYACEKCVKALKSGKDAGKKIDSYEVIKTLGEGGMGRVYQVYHPPTARVLAMKQVLRLSVKELIQRFEREIRIMRELEHKNTLRYIDSGVSDEGPYLVMELASHGNLDDQIEAHQGFLSPTEAVAYVLEALDGLEFIHQRGIVHRDLKPANILLQKAADGRVIPKIADFGLAKRYTESGGSLMTQLGVGIGSILYMPPEQIKDTRSVREPADLYSMGVTLYYLLTGQYPYHFPTRREIERFLEQQRHKVKNEEEAMRLLMEVQKMKSPQVIVLTEEPIPIRQRKSDIPKKLAEVVDKAIRKEMAARFQSAAEFRQALQGAI